jgi:hypothetical protein
VQHRERQLHVRLDTLGAGRLEVLCHIGRITQQRCLADAGFAANHQRAAAARPDIGRVLHRDHAEWLDNLAIRAEGYPAAGCGGRCGPGAGPGEPPAQWGQAYHPAASRRSDLRSHSPRRC